MTLLGVRSWKQVAPTLYVLEEDGRCGEVPPMSSEHSCCPGLVGQIVTPPSVGLAVACVNWRSGAQHFSLLGKGGGWAGAHCDTR